MKKQYKYHLYFLIIISFFYSLHYIFFNGFIISYREEAILNTEIPTNFIIGQIYKGDTYLLDSLTGGEFKWYYLVRIFFISNLLYSFFNVDNAYLIIDLTHRFLGYFFFFKLSLKITKNFDLSFLSSLLFSFVASSSEAAPYLTSVLGFGIISLPYLLYLSVKDKITPKNYVVLFFLSIHTHFYLIPVIILCSLLSFCLYQDQKLPKLIKINSFYIFFCLLVASNILFLIGFFNDQDINRNYWNKDYLSLSKSLINTFNLIISNPIQLINLNEKNIIWTSYFFNKLPYFIFFLLSFYLIFFKSYKNKKLIILLYVTITIIIFISYTTFYKHLLNYAQFKLLESYNIDRLHLFLIFLSSFIIIITQKNLSIKNYFLNPFGLTIIFIIILFFSQNILVPVIKSYLKFDYITTEDKNKIKQTLFDLKLKKTFEIVKKNQILKKNYEIAQNALTINNFYDFKNYKYIKSIVKDSYVLPINITPMKLLVNKIKIIGGRFQIYPQKHKIDFAKIYSNELLKNKNRLNDHNKYGDDMSIITTDKKNIEIDFSYAKKIGAEFVLSKHQIESKNLSIVCLSCNDNKFLNLYKINNNIY